MDHDDQLIEGPGVTALLEAECTGDPNTCLYAGGYGNGDPVPRCTITNGDCSMSKVR